MSLSLYGSSGDVRAELGNPSELEYSADDIARARTRATNVVNAYVQTAYPSQVPFESGSEPELLKTVTDDLSVYFAKRSKHPGMAPLTEEIKTEYYDKSIDLLKLISEGTVSIPELEGSSGSSISANSDSYIPIFSDASEAEDSTLDSNKVDDVADERT